jgi:uncharacterized protein YjbI with pentapeptide repeats
MTQTELSEILERHRKWLVGEAGGQRAVLSGTDLIGMDLSGVDLSQSQMIGADMRYTNLTKAKLFGANMYGTNLSGAEMARADIRLANLSRASLIEVDMHKANLQNADMRRADMSRASLLSVDLSGANLAEANLIGAYWYYSCLPLWCGGLHIKLDRRQMAQLIYHFCSMECEDSEVLALQKSLYAFANEFAESRDDLKNKKFPEA